MNRRIGLMFCIGVMLVLLTGCTGESKYSEEQETILVDHVAQIVLKHTEGYDYKLVDVLGNPFIKEEEIDEIDAGKLPEDETNEDEKDDIESDSSDDSSSKDTVEDDKEEPEEEISLSQAFGFDENIKVKVMKTSVSDDLSKGAYHLEPDKGEKLCVVDVKITNESDKKVQIKYKKSKIRLVIGTEEYKPMITALENDIAFLSSKVAAGKSTTAKIVFSISDKEEKNDKSLSVKTDDKKTTVKLN